MAKRSETTIIKKYANRRLYNTGTSMYVTLENLAKMVKGNEDFIVQDAKTGEDITHSVLTQIIFEQENKSGQTLMPITFLRQLIRFYGDGMQMVIPAYLEQSMAALSKEQDSFRSSGHPMAQTTRLIEEQVRRNTEMFRQAMEMFNPFLAGAIPNETTPPAEDVRAERPDELSALREQVAQMQKKLDSLDARKDG